MPNTLYTLTTNLTLESALPLDSDIIPALQQAMLLISGKLQQFTKVKNESLATCHTKWGLRACFNSLY
jgi:hypothetical protein